MVAQPPREIRPARAPGRPRREMPGTPFAWANDGLIRHLAGTVPHRGGSRMRIRSLAILVASLSLMTVGCATKKFVREEVGKSEAKIGADVGRVDSALYRGEGAHDGDERSAGPDEGRGAAGRQPSRRGHQSRQDGPGPRRRGGDQGHPGPGPRRRGSRRRRPGDGQGGRDQLSPDPALGQPQQARAGRHGRHPLPLRQVRSWTTAARPRCSTSPSSSRTTRTSWSSSRASRTASAPCRTTSS